MVNYLWWCILQEAIQVDGDVLFGLLKRTNPPVYKHLVSIALTLSIIYYTQ